jgi:hypothetical protein
LFQFLPLNLFSPIQSSSNQQFVEKSGTSFSNTSKYFFNPNKTKRFSFVDPHFPFDLLANNPLQIFAIKSFCF